MALRCVCGRVEIKKFMRDGVRVTTHPAVDAARRGPPRRRRDIRGSTRPRACGRRNKAPLQVKYDERCDIIVHRIRRKAAGDDRIRATFRTERYRPTCTVCQTPIDYE